MIIAVDFDGTLCQHNFPNIGRQLQHHKKLVNLLIDLRMKGHKLILWTNRGDNQNFKSLTQAIQWCKRLGLQFDSVNQNIPGQKKLSGYSPKVLADIYIDDRALGFFSNCDINNTLNFLQEIKCK